MDAKVLEGIKRATLRVKTILDESEALLRELKSRRPRTPDVSLEQELAPSNHVSDLEPEEAEGQQESEHVEDQQVEDNQLEDEEVEEQPLEENHETDTSKEEEQNAYVSSDEEDISTPHHSNWCCCRRG